MSKLRSKEDEKTNLKIDLRHEAVVQAINLAASDYEAQIEPLPGFVSPPDEVASTFDEVFKRRKGKRTTYTQPTGENLALYG